MILFVTCALVGVLCLLLVLSPFWLVKNTQLEATSALKNPEDIANYCQTILSQYEKNQQALHDGFIGPYEWRRRNKFLENRYIDGQKRLDYLKAVEDSP